MAGETRKPTGNHCDDLCSLKLLMQFVESAIRRNGGNSIPDIGELLYPSECEDYDAEDDLDSLVRLCEDAHEARKFAVAIPKSVGAREAENELTIIIESVAPVIDELESLTCLAREQPEKVQAYCRELHGKLAERHEATLQRIIFRCEAELVVDAPQVEHGIAVDISRGIISVDGTEYPAKAHWCAAVQALIDEGGRYLTGPQLCRLHGCAGKKWSREFTKLKSAIPAIANRIKSDGPLGYRLICS